MFEINILKKCIIIFLMMVGLLLVSSAECQMNIFEIGIEKKISSQDMDCNYRSEDYGKYSFNFEYPKLIITQDREPLVAFLDIKSTKLIITEISDKETKILSNIPAFGSLFWKKWPIIFIKGSKTYFAVYSGYHPSSESQLIKLYLLDRETGKLNLQDEKIFTGDKRCELWGIYPYHDNFMLIGSCNYICLRYLPSVLMGGNPTYYQNASFILDGPQKLLRQPIEEQGCHNVFKQSYNVSESSGIQATWVRETKGLGLQYDRIIYYSTNKDGTKWSPPAELYSVKDTKNSDHLNDLSLSSVSDSTFILWQDIREGIFFSEIRNGIRIETLKISDIKKMDIPSQEPLPAASTIKVASDNSGNVYALWTKNSGKDYTLYFKARIGGQWKPEVIINQGPGYLKLPDMKIDKEGRVHITYIKSINPNEPHGKYGCFYIKLEQREKVSQSEKARWIN